MCECHECVSIKNSHAVTARVTFPVVQCITGIWVFHSSLSFWFQQLHHNDRLVLAGLYYFRVGSPPPYPEPGAATLQSDNKKLDFYFSRDELLKEQQTRCGQIDMQWLIIFGGVNTEVICFLT